jgi:hypothetical protein
MSASVRSTWATFLLVSLIAAPAAAQGFNGAIIGAVRDPTGAVVPETALTLRNLATDQIVGTAVSGTSRRASMNYRRRKAGFSSYRCPTSR